MPVLQGARSLHCAISSQNGEPGHYAVRCQATRPSLPVEEGLLVSITPLQPLRVNRALAASCHLNPHWLGGWWQLHSCLPCRWAQPPLNSVADTSVGKGTEWDATGPYHRHYVFGSFFMFLTVLMFPLSSGSFFGHWKILRAPWCST